MHTCVFSIYLLAIVCSHAQVYSVRVRVNSDHVLSVLLERGQFDVARKYAAIVGSTASEVTIKEVSE